MSSLFPSNYTVSTPSPTPSAASRFPSPSLSNPSTPQTEHIAPHHSPITPSFPSLPPSQSSHLRVPGSSSLQPPKSGLKKIPPPLLSFSTPHNKTPSHPSPNSLISPLSLHPPPILSPSISISSPLKSALKSTYAPPAPIPSSQRRQSSFDPTARIVAKSVRKEKDNKERRKPGLEARRSSQGGYTCFEWCLEGGRGHQVKAGSFVEGSGNAKHHLGRALELFSAALTYEPDSKEATLGRHTIIYLLCSAYHPPSLSIPLLRSSTTSLRSALQSASLPPTIPFLSTLAKSTSLLSALLLELPPPLPLPTAREIWASEVGALARESLALWEGTASVLVEQTELAFGQELKVLALKSSEVLMSLATTALGLADLAPAVREVEGYHSLVDTALDQAATMILVVKPITEALEGYNPFLTSIHLLACEANLHRLSHLFQLGQPLGEDELRGIIKDIEILAERERVRAKSLRGSKAGAASTSGFLAVKQLAETKVAYARLMRQVWRKRRAGAMVAVRKGSVAVPAAEGRGSGGRQGGSRKSSGIGRGSVNPFVIAEEEEEKEREGSGSDGSTSRKAVQLPVLLRGASTTSTISSFAEHSEPSTPSDFSHQSLLSDAQRKQSAVYNFSYPLQSPESSSFLLDPRMASPLPSPLPSPPLYSAEFPADPTPRLTSAPPAMTRRGSWMPTTIDAPSARARRISSINLSAPADQPAVSEWTRKASVICLSVDEPAGQVSTMALAQSSWDLLDAATKHYKVALTMLQTSDMSANDLAEAKSSVLLGIADVSSFKATLGARLHVPDDKRTACQVSAEVYATWAAREVGWASIIEGTPSSVNTERRTTSWRADELGKAAVLTLLRIWWYRAASGGPKEVDTRNAAKDAVERVVKRLREREVEEEEEGGGQGVVDKFRSGILRVDGEMDASEEMFWGSVKRILNGGKGYVMS